MAWAAHAACAVQHRAVVWGSAAGGATLRSARALGAVGGGKEAVVADAVETLGQHVDQETSDELVRLKPHRLPSVGAVDAIIFPAERDRVVIGCNEATVRDGDPMGVTGEIAQDLFGSRERSLAIDHPADAPQGGDEAFERSLVGKPGMG